MWSSRFQILEYQSHFWFNVGSSLMHLSHTQCRRNDCVWAFYNRTHIQFHPYHIQRMRKNWKKWNLLRSGMLQVEIVCGDTIVLFVLFFRKIEIYRCTVNIPLYCWNFWQLSETSIEISRNLRKFPSPFPKLETSCL